MWSNFKNTELTTIVLWKNHAFTCCWVVLMIFIKEQLSWQKAHLKIYKWLWIFKNKKKNKHILKNIKNGNKHSILFSMIYLFNYVYLDLYAKVSAWVCLHVHTGACGGQKLSWFSWNWRFKWLLNTVMYYEANVGSWKNSKYD